MKKLKTIFSISLILIITFAAFFPCLKNGFVNWDDDRYIIENPVIQGLSAYNIKQIFTSSFVGNYQPVTMLSYLFEYGFFKLDPFGYHLTNLILHLLNCLLIFWLIYMLSRRIPVALMTAILFGIHPLHVESVAWISERKDVLYALFFLAAVICYCYYLRDKETRRYYYLSLALFVLSLLSKAMAITLPVILLLIDYYLRRKRDKSLFMDKIPFFILSFVFGAIALVSQYSIGAVRDESSFSFLNIIAVSGYSVIFYLNKIFMPVELSCLYPPPRQEDFFLLLLPCVIFIILLTAVILSAKYTRKIIFGSGFFLITILPVLQFIPIGETVVADRYSYIPSLGIFYILAEGLFWLYSRKMKYPRFFQCVILALLIWIAGFLMSLTWQRCLVWKDSLSLWSDVLKKYPDSATAYNNRGAGYLTKKEYAKAYDDLMTALKINQNYHEAYFNLGILYNSRGDYGEAIKLINKTLQMDPGYLKAYDMLAVIYGSRGKHSEVITICKKAIQIKRDHAQAYINLCGAYGNLGNFQEAIVYGKKAVAFSPGSALAHMNLSAAYFYAGEYDLAVKHCGNAIALGHEVSPEFLEELKDRI